MIWTPLGPTVVVHPRYTDYARLARANEFGGQCPVLGIAVHPGNEQNIVAVVRRVGGTSAFRTTDDGHSWRAIADQLTRVNPQLDLSCAAVHPVLPDVVYLGARSGQQVFVSLDGGGTWPVQHDPGGKVTQLIVDSRSAGAWNNATLYAATSVGVAYSSDGGQSWSMAAIGEVSSLAVYTPASGAPRFYAGVYGQGLFYAEAPSGPWQNLLGTAGLPAAASLGANFVVLIDYNPRTPDRVYAMLAPLSLDHGGPYALRLFVSTAAPPAWTWVERGAGMQPPLDFYLEGVAFLVAPENSGADTGDVLFSSAGILLQRSTDGGRTWEFGSELHHYDTRSLAHHPPKNAYYPDVLPPGASPPQARIYVGSDGGIGASRGYSNPAFNFAGPGSDPTYNSGTTYVPAAGLVESLNHGLASVPAHQLASNPDSLAGGPMSMIVYLSALDGDGTRRIGSTASTSFGGDSGPIYAAQHSDGVHLWMNDSATGHWPGWNLLTRGDDTSGSGSYTSVATAAAPSCAATSNMVPASPGDLYAGIIAFEPVTTLAAAVSAGGVVDVFPAMMTPDLVVGAKVSLGSPGFGYPITTVYSDHFTVYVSGGPYPAGAAVLVVRSYVARVTATSADRISQIFVPQTRRIYRIVRSGDSLLAASADQRLWLVSPASTASSSTMWTEVTGRPAALSGASLDDPSDLRGGEYCSGLELQRTTPLIASLTADSAGTLYVMLSSAVSASIGGTPVDTILFRVAGGAWVAESCPPPPEAIIPPGVAMGRIVAHPVAPGRLFVARNARLFQLDTGTSGWTWTDLTDNLPGQEIHDLWIGNVAPAGAPARFVLRAATAVRGVWEMEVGAAPLAGVQLYFRDHAFDPGWLGPSADGISSPFLATQKHWHWQSADIKVDTPLRDSTAALYYQNDPEAPVPKAGDFAWMKDRSQVASAGVTARVWVRVNNRAAIASGSVNVWAIACLFSGGLPLLPADIWSRFHGDGTIDAALPGGGSWTSLGLQPVTGIEPEHPGIAGFLLATGSEGDHRCIVAFVHGPGALLDTTGLSLIVDEVVPLHPQIAQRNVLVGVALSPSPGTPTPVLPGGNLVALGAREIRTYIEFNNPRSARLETALRFDLGGIPAQTDFEFRLSLNAKPSAITGAHSWSVKDGFFRWCWILLLRFVDFLLTLVGLGRKPRPGKRLPLSHQPYVTRGGVSVEVRNVPLEPQGKAAAELVLRFGGELEPGSEHHMDVLQMAREKVIGGATILVPVANGKLALQEKPGDVNAELERDSSGEAEARRSRLS